MRIYGRNHRRSSEFREMTLMLGGNISEERMDEWKLVG